MKLQTILHTAIFYIALCKSLTISKSRGGRAIGAVCDRNADPADPNSGCDTNEVCDGVQDRCLCDTNFVKDPVTPFTACVATIGGSCAAGEDDCSLDNQQCQDPATTPANQEDTDGCADCVCGCDTPRFMDNGAGACLSTIGGPCATNADCTLNAQVCNTASGICLCDTALGFANNGAAAPAPMICVVSVGGACPIGNECTLDNQQCTAATCACIANFAQDAGGDCVESVGAPCVTTGLECTLDNQECQVTATGAVTVVAGLLQACACSALFAENPAGACVASVDGDCSANGDPDCTLANQECQDPANANVLVPAGGTAGAICGCEAGFEPQDGICVRSLGIACVDMMCDLDNSECAGGFCVCTAPFVDNNGAVAAGACAPTIDGACPLGTECNLANQECQLADGNPGATPATVGVAQTCQCQATFSEDAVGACAASVGGVCTVADATATPPEVDTCTLANQFCDDAVPAAPICACDALFDPNDDGTCVESLGAACPLGTECTLDGQACNNDPTTPICIVSVGGACTAADATTTPPTVDTCTLANQFCDAAVPAAPICACDGGWTQNAAGACAAANFDFCDTVVGGCALGQGDCDEDNDCAKPLACGVNNCGPGRALADCCYDPTIVVDCDGTDGNMWACCSPTNQCAEGKGDCDTKDDCAGDLVCGANNCQGDAFNTDPNFPINQADCCVSTLFYNKEDLFDEEGFDKRKEWFRNDGERAQSRPKF